MNILKTLSIVAVLAFAGTALYAQDGPSDYPPPPYDPHVMHNMKDPQHWYPVDCCSGQDCAPADAIERVSEWNGRWITSRHGKAWVPDSKKTHTARDKDGNIVDFEIPPFEKIRTHICMRTKLASDPQPEHGTMHVLCLFGEPNY